MVDEQRPAPTPAGLTESEQAALERRMAGYGRGKAKAMRRSDAAQGRSPAQHTPRPRYQRPTYRVSRGLMWAGIAAGVLAAPFTVGASLIVPGIAVLIFGLPNRAPCPHCNGRVKLGVAVCRHCGRDIVWAP